ELHRQPPAAGIENRAGRGGVAERTRNIRGRVELRGGERSAVGDRRRNGPGDYRLRLYDHELHRPARGGVELRRGRRDGERVRAGVEDRAGGGNVRQRTGGSRTG